MYFCLLFMYKGITLLCNNNESPVNYHIIYNLYCERPLHYPEKREKKRKEKKKTIPAQLSHDAVCVYSDMSRALPGHSIHGLQ